MSSRRSDKGGVKMTVFCFFMILGPSPYQAHTTFENKNKLLELLIT
jgi:hypothetical protein